MGPRCPGPTKATSTRNEGNHLLTGCDEAHPAAVIEPTAPYLTRRPCYDHSEGSGHPGRSLEPGTEEVSDAMARHARGAARSRLLRQPSERRLHDQRQSHLKWGR